LKSRSANAGARAKPRSKAETRREDVRSFEMGVSVQEDAQAGARTSYTPIGERQRTRVERSSCSLSVSRARRAAIRKLRALHPAGSGAVVR
jgi:hypothetical protein